MKLKTLFFALPIFGCAFLLSGCSQVALDRVVLYCSVDDVYAKPIVAELEKKTGLQIEVLYDVEAAKTAGLANRIRAEKSRPRGDVFWSSALLQTLLLKKENLLLEYSSPSAKDIPAAFKDKDGYWAGMGVRRRVIMHSEKLAGSASSKELLNPKWAGKIGISNPQFGTASDWAAVLATRWGKEKTLDYFKALKENGVRVLPGNGVVAEKVARGELLAGVTDSDDYFASKPDKKKVLFRDFQIGSAKNSVVFIPGSVAILKSAPHRANAQKLVDALLELETEQKLVRTMPGVEPVHKSKLTVPNDCGQWAQAWISIRNPLADMLLTP